MPYPLDLDPLVPQAPVTPEPWSWVPPEWAQGGGVVPTLPPEAPAIPPDNTGASWFVPPEWSAPAQPAVPPEWLPPTGAPEAAPAPTAPPLQPGLPIPSQTLEAAAAAPPMAPHVPTVDEQAYAESADPLAAGFKTIDLEAARGEVKRTAQQRADDASRDAAVANMRILHEANERTRTDLAKIDADYKALADQKIGWASKSAPQKIAGIVAAIVGGLVQSRTGAARNQGVDMVDHIIEGEIAEHHQKMAELAGRRKDVTAQFGQSLDTFRTEETLRQSMWELAARDVETKAAGFDPKGTTYAKKIALATEFRQRAAAAKAAAQERLFKDQLELSKHALEVDKFRLEREKERAKERAAGAAGAAGIIQPPEYYAQRGLEPPPVPMSEKDYKGWLANKGKSLEIGKTKQEIAGGTETEQLKKKADLAKAAAEAQAAGEGFVIHNPETGVPLLQPNGDPFTVADASDRAKTRAITIAASNVRRLADRMAQMKEQHGGVIKALGSAEAQEIQSLASSIDFETFKAFDLGAPSEGDKQLAEGVRGGVDPTSFVRDATAGFQAYANTVEQKALAQLHGVGYRGDRLRFHRASDLKPSEPSVVDEMVRRIAGAGDYSPIDPNAPNAELAQETRRVLGETPAVKPLKQADEAFEILEAYAAQPRTYEAARAGLTELAAKAASPAARARAKAILDSLPGAQQRGSEAR